MNEPDNLTLVLVGSLADTDPWHLEVWARDDVNARNQSACWYPCGGGDEDEGVAQRLSWDRLLERARARKAPVTVLGAGAR